MLCCGDIILSVTLKHAGSKALLILPIASLSNSKFGESIVCESWGVLYFKVLFPSLIIIETLPSLGVLAVEVEFPFFSFNAKKFRKLFEMSDMVDSLDTYWLLRWLLFFSVGTLVACCVFLCIDFL